MTPSIHENFLDVKEQKSYDRKTIDFLRRRMDFLHSFDMLSKNLTAEDITKINIVQIAQNAGLTKPTFYRYFPNKEDFLIAYAAYTYEKLTKLMEKQLFSKASVDKQIPNMKSRGENKSNTLLSLVLAYYQFTQKHPASVQILNEIGQKDTVSTLREKYENKHEELTQSEISYLRERKKFRNSINNVFEKKNLEIFIAHYPNFAISDISEIFLLIFNGIITEFTQKNRVLQNKGIKEETILIMVVNLISRGMDTFL